MRLPSPQPDSRPPASAFSPRQRDPVAAIRFGVAGAPAPANGPCGRIHSLGSRCRRLRAGLLMALVVTACGDGGTAVPTLPFAPSLGQAWVGWLVSLPRGTRTVTITLFQSGPAVTGFWTVFEADGPASGTLTGTIVGSTALLTLRPYAPDACAISVVAVIRSARLEGTWSKRDCGREEIGTVILDGQ